MFNYISIIVGSWKSRFKIFEFKCLWNQYGVVPKQRYDKLPPVGDHIHVTLTYDHAWATPDHTVIGVS